MRTEDTVPEPLELPEHLVRLALLRGREARGERCELAPQVGLRCGGGVQCEEGGVVCGAEVVHQFGRWGGWRWEERRTFLHGREARPRADDLVARRAALARFHVRRVVEERCAEQSVDYKHPLARNEQPVPSVHACAASL